MTSPAPSPRQTFLGSFTELLRMPPALWLVIGAFVVDTSAYFGVLTLMTTYLSADLRWGDTWAGMGVSFFTGLVTLFMLGFGSLAERLGLRRGILLALAACVLGRLIFSGAAGLTPWFATSTVLVAILVTAIGEAILQPLCYSGVKQFTNERTSSMGYGLIYAFMNFGIFVIGAVSSWIRPAVQDLKDGKTTAGTGGLDGFLAWLASFSGSGVQAVNWVCVGVTITVLVGFFCLMSRGADAKRLRPEQFTALGPAGSSLWSKLSGYFLDGPFSNPRFVFFIFMLLPVRTLFAHQWLTMPSYILRAYDQTVGEYSPWLIQLGEWFRPWSGGLADGLRWLTQKEVADLMEWLVNWINPLVIFIGVPVLTALTRRANVYTMMILGSFVSAVPTFLLCFGANLDLLIVYFVVFSIGEALWSARFLEYASELAPPGRVAQYMGLAQIPWLLAKMTTGLYSGYMLSQFCPEHGPMRTGTLWFIYGCVAMISPIGLWLARKWVRAGLETKR